MVALPAKMERYGVRLVIIIGIDFVIRFVQQQVVDMMGVVLVVGIQAEILRSKCIELITLNVVNTRRESLIRCEFCDFLFVLFKLKIKE